MAETLSLIVGLVLGVLFTYWMVLPELNKLQELQAKPRPTVDEDQEDVDLPRYGPVEIRRFRLADYEQAPPGCNRGHALTEGDRYFVVSVMGTDGGEIVVCPDHAPFPVADEVFDA